MTLQEVLKEIDVVSKVVSKSTTAQLTFEGVGSDEELKIFTDENRLTLHTPDGQFPEYWFCYDYNGIDCIIKGKKKEIKINY